MQDLGDIITVPPNLTLIKICRVLSD